ncbi:hypothetical protein JOF29_002341 [Kribbella aluminosa]|uniref:Uncharacterized protein n=2 Tax=Kribbella aluminosa TaxID=416017 RepID=A0ABS4UHY3_9ACTN|nr:hypothetical protein [Kribbella aluminosa]MBP2351258.1 hypothetical protein [Kribbella aluminosa]
MGTLANRAIDQPVVMRWDAIADEIVRNRLGDVVPQDPAHEQAARAELINAMVRPDWATVDEAQPIVGHDIAQSMTQSLDEATERIREHYAQSPNEPYPAKTPNFEIARQQSQALQGPQNRTRTADADLTNYPPPAPGTRVDAPAPIQPAATAAQRQTAGPTVTSRRQERVGRGGAEQGAAGEAMRFLDGQTAAAYATHQKPSLGDGARGAGSESGQNVHREAPDRGNTPTDRGH